MAMAMWCNAASLKMDHAKPTACFWCTRAVQRQQTETQKLGSVVLEDKHEGEFPNPHSGLYVSAVYFQNQHLSLENFFKACEVCVVTLETTKVHVFADLSFWA